MRYNDLELLDNCPWDIFLKLLMTKADYDKYYPIVQSFMNWDHPVKQGVINAYLIWAIWWLNGRDFNEEFLRIGLETWYKKYGIKTTQAALDRLMWYKESLTKKNNKEVKKEPEWFGEFYDDLSKKEW